MAVARRASSFRQQHFHPDSEVAGLETEGLQKLRQLCNQLGQADDTCVAELLEVREGGRVWVGGGGAHDILFGFTTPILADSPV